MTRHVYVPLDMHSNKITNLYPPTDSGDAVTKSFMDIELRALKWKTPVVMATKTNVNLADCGPVDGITVTAGMRVLLLGQTNTAHNGIYIGSDGPPMGLQRPVIDYNDYQGAAVFVEKGTYADTAWYCTAEVGGVLNTTPAPWIPFSVPPAGTPTGRFLKDDSTWATPAGGGAGVDPVHMRRTITAPQTFTNGNALTVLYGSQTESVGGITYSAGIFTIPVAGRYYVGVGHNWVANATGRRTLVIWRNGVGIAGQDLIPHASTSHTNDLSTTADFAAGDTVQIVAYQNSGVSLDNVATDRVFCSITMVGGPKGDTGDAFPNIYSDRQANSSTLTTGTLTKISSWTNTETVGMTTGAGITVLTAGRYLVTWAPTYAVSGTGSRVARITVDGVNVAQARVQATTIGGARTAISLTKELRLAVGNVVEFWGLHEHSASLTIDAESYAQLRYVGP